MSWKKRAERAYHHGNLREALIQAARDLIKEKGPAGFTFADAARSAGVSPAAPYRHFRDREALLADVAREGFQRFEAMLTTGWNGGMPDAMTAFNNVGKAYLAFARAEPAYYAAMFESGLPPDLSPDLRAASDRAFGVLRAAADDLRVTLDTADDLHALQGLVEALGGRSDWRSVVAVLRSRPDLVERNAHVRQKSLAEG